MICARCQQPSGDSAICKQCVARLLPTARHGRTSLEPDIDGERTLKVPPTARNPRAVEILRVWRVPGEVIASSSRLSAGEPVDEDGGIQFDPDIWGGILFSAISLIADGMADQCATEETKPQVYDEIVKIIVDSIVRESEEKNVSPKNDIDPPSE